MSVMMPVLREAPLLSGNFSSQLPFAVHLWQALLTHMNQLHLGKTQTPED